MKKLGLALSGGGGKALCYLGFIERLKEAGINPQYLSAHSGGAILLCFMEAGLAPQEIVREWSHFRYWHIAALNPLANHGLLSIDRYIKYIRQFIGYKDIANMRYDTTIYTSDLTDFDQPRRVAHNTGDLATIAVISSLAPPHSRFIVMRIRFSATVA